VAGSWCWLVLREEYCWLVAGGWFVLREKYCWLVAGGWFVLRKKYCWLVADKASEQMFIVSSTFIWRVCLSRNFHSD
jgi:hypothetical protein